MTDRAAGLRPLIPREKVDKGLSIIGVCTAAKEEGGGFSDLQVSTFPRPGHLNARMTQDRISNPTMGIFWMLVTGALFVGVTALVKHMGPRIPAAEAAFLRYALGLVFLLPFLRRLLALRLDRQMLGVFVGRGAVHTVAVLLWFFAMARIPIADVTAMNYLSPVYVTLGAALFLGERLALRRILAVVVALIGALIILRPGFRELSTGHLAMLVTAVCFGASYLLAKRASEQYDPIIVVAMLSVMVTIGLAPLAIPVWITPTSTEMLILFGVACLATMGHYTMTLAFRAAPLAVTQPVTFLQLIWAVLLGYFAFDEGVDGFVIFGGLVIVGAISFMSWREMMLKRQAVTPTVSETKV